MATLTDAAIWREFEALQSAGFDDRTAINAVVQNHAMNANHADELAERVRAVVVARIAPLMG